MGISVRAHIFYGYLLDKEIDIAYENEELSEKIQNSSFYFINDCNGSKEYFGCSLLSNDCGWEITSIEYDTFEGIYSDSQVEINEMLEEYKKLFPELAKKKKPKFYLIAEYSW